MFSFLAIIAAIISTLRGLNKAEEDREDELQNNREQN
jgi:hypothetical protein